MSYTPTNWQTGDTITAEKLNKLENGVASGGSNRFVVTFTNDGNDNWSADKTLAECSEAYLSGATMVAVKDSYIYTLQHAYVDGNEAYFDFVSATFSGGDTVLVGQLSYYYDVRHSATAISYDSITVTGQMNA